MGELRTRDRVLAYLTALVAVFCLAYVAGTVAAPALAPPTDTPGMRHE